MRVKKGRTWEDLGPGNGTAGSSRGQDTEGRWMNAAGVSPGMLQYSDIADQVAADVDRQRLLEPQPLSPDELRDDS